MSKRILNMITLVCLLVTLSACSEKQQIEQRIDGLWEIQLSSQRDYLYWYDTCGFIGQILFFDQDRHECSLPGVEETLEERAKEYYKGSWFIDKTESKWLITINPRKHPLQGVFNISFYKDTIFDSEKNEEIRYFMNLKNEEWDIVCKKSGIITNTW